MPSSRQSRSMTANGTPWAWSPQTQRLTDVVLGSFDRSAAAERIVELERHVFRLQAAVSGERRSRHWSGRQGYPAKCARGGRRQSGAGLGDYYTEGNTGEHGGNEASIPSSTGTDSQTRGGAHGCCRARRFGPGSRPAGTGRSADIRRRVTHVGEPGANPRNPGESTLRSGDRTP